MAARKRGLGRGLDALLGSVSAEAGDAGDDLRELALDAITPGAHQPRREFDPEALEELAQSIRSQGVVQPVVVRPLAGGRYELVAGERRWRAARLAGLATIPAVVRQMDDRAAMAVALVENIQRADLNPLEEAEALGRLIAQCGLTHEQCAQAIGRSRVAVTHLLRLMDLEEPVKDLVRSRALTLGHAKALLAVVGEQQVSLARQVVSRGLTVRQTEALVRRASEEPAPAPRAPARDVALERRLSERIGLPVRLRADDKGRGKLTVSFRSRKEMEALLARLGQATGGRD